MIYSFKTCCIVFLFVQFMALSCARDNDGNESKSEKGAQQGSFTIAVQPLGKVDKHIVDDIISGLQSTYGADILQLPQKPMYQEAFVNIKSPRYRADSLLKFLKRDMPAKADYILGITSRDISTTKYELFPLVIKKPASKYRDWGVFGLGSCPGKSCMVSTFRVKTEDRQLGSERMQKIAIHEVGHNLGLKHCSDKSCVMTDAVESVATVDNALKKLCNKCTNQLGRWKLF